MLFKKYVLLLVKFININIENGIPIYYYKHKLNTMYKK